MNALEQLNSEAEKASAVLLEIELDPTRELLSGASLTGTTAERWTSVDAALQDAWEAQAALEALLKSSPVDGAAAEPMLDRMFVAGEQAKTLLETVAATWDALVPRLRAMNATLRACTELGATPATEQRELARLTALVAGDPLGAHEEPIEALEAAVAAVQAASEDWRDFRAQPTERLAAARARVGEARALEADARAAHAAVVEKIADPDVPAPRAVPDDLQRGLDDVAARVEAEDWPGAHAALEAWMARADELVRELRRTLAAIRAPLDARRELRGLLDAYHAKARALRALEDPGLHERFERAERALHTAPTDLAEAERLVHGYRDQLPTEVRR